MEHVTQRGLLVDEVMLDVKTVNAVLHAMEAGDVGFVVGNDDRFPLSEGGLFFGINLDVLRWRHGVSPLVGRFIILPSTAPKEGSGLRHHAV
jgi:hypothetical protein